MRNLGLIDLRSTGHDSNKMELEKGLIAAQVRHTGQSITYLVWAFVVGCGGPSEPSNWHGEESSVGGATAVGGVTAVGGATAVGGRTNTTMIPVGGSTVRSGGGSAAPAGGTLMILQEYGGNVAVAGTGSAGASSAVGGSAQQPPYARFPFCSRPHETTSPIVDESEFAVPPGAAGFVEIPQVSYRALSDSGEFAEHVSGAAKLFFSFVAADQDAERAPLFLIFNGGPGGATMNALRAHGTAPMSINTSTGAVEANPYSWSKWANLLYVDARQAGFSYSELERTESSDALSPACPNESFNRLVDAADFVRVLLEIYARFPVLEDNPVVVVGESWGGIRAQYVLNLLRNPSELATGGDGRYVDDELVAALQRHRARVDDRREAVGLPRLDPGEQFSWQVLIQPAIVSALPFGYRQLQGCAACVAALEGRAKELGIELPAPFMHQINLPAEEAAARDVRTRETLLSPDGFEQLLGVSLESVELLRPEMRRAAMRFGVEGGMESWCSPPSVEWMTQLGELTRSDCYFMSLSPCGCPNDALSGDLGWHGGKLFLKNLRGVHTFVTRALLDGVIVADAIPAILQAYAPGSGWNSPMHPGDPDALQSVVATHAPVAGVARPGHIDVTYLRAPAAPANSTRAPAAPANSTRAPADPTSTVRRIRFPTYDNAGHEVAASSPRELSEDILEFLCAPETL